MSARLRLWWRAVRDRRRFEADMRDEMAFHVDARADDLVAGGLPRADALRQARLELGMAELHRDDCRRARGLAWLDASASDLRYALRSLRRSPAYATTALLVLTVAIAANALLFALFNGYAFRDPPIRDPQRWVNVDMVDAERNHYARWPIDAADPLVATPPAPFAGLYSVRDVRLPLDTGVLRRGFGEAVSANYFDVLGVPASAGRVFAPGRDDRGGIVLSELGRERLFDGATDVIGRSLLIGGRRFDVIGVAANDFRGTFMVSALYWMLEQDYRELQPGSEEPTLDVDIGGMLREDADLASAADALRPRVRALMLDPPDGYAIVDAAVEPRRGYLTAYDRNEALLAGTPVAIAFGMVLLIAAANLANLVLARFAARRHELAIRVAVGAPRRRLVGQLVAECMLLACIAATVGTLLAGVLLDPCHRAAFSLLGDFGLDVIEVAIDLRVFGYAAALALASALVFGWLPALLVTAPWRNGGDPDPAALRRADPGRLRNALMVGQIACSVALLIIAALIAVNARNAVRTPLGFDPTRIVAVHVTPTAAHVRALQRLPQVQAVSAASNTPLTSMPYQVAATAGGRSRVLQVRRVDAQYFDVLGLEVLRGRGLRREDEAAGSVAAISRRTAERLWPGENPVGRTLPLAAGDDDPLGVPATVQIVGVVDDVATGWLIDGVDRSALYLPTPVGSDRLVTLLARVGDSTPATLAALQRACIDADPGRDCMPLPMTTAVRIQQLPFLLAADVASMLGWTALAISCIGLYGLVSFCIVQRRREIGVRLALGATRAGVVRLVVAGAARQIALGVAIGVPCAFAFSRLVAAVTERVQTFDVAAFTLTPLLLVAIALGAAWLPARRTSAIMPSEALRHE